jgi:hypothetical protein
MASSTKPITDMPRATQFVAEMPETQKEMEDKAPALVTSRAEARLIGQLIIKYIPLKEGMPEPPNMVTPVWGSRLSDGVMLLHAEFSVTNAYMRVKLLQNYTIESFIKCDIKLPDNPMSFVLVHIEPVEYSKLEKLKDTADNLDAIFRPPLVHHANNHVGVAVYNMHRANNEICVESVELKLNHATLTAWTHAVNDQLRIAQGGIPIVEVANHNIQRFPPGSRNQSAQNDIPPSFPESAKVPVQNAPKPANKQLVPGAKQVVSTHGVVTQTVPVQTVSAPAMSAKAVTAPAPGTTVKVAPPTLEQLRKMVAKPLTPEEIKQMKMNVKPLQPPVASPI